MLPFYFVNYEYTLLQSNRQAGVTVVGGDNPFFPDLQLCSASHRIEQVISEHECRL
jgi:hypothetical protein